MYCANNLYKFEKSSNLYTTSIYIDYVNTVHAICAFAYSIHR